MIDSFQLRLLPSPDVLSGFTERVLWGRINDHEVALFIAEMDRRGIHTELGYKNLPQVFVHAVRWDVKVSRQRIKHARLISREVTPTGVELEPELPATASAMAEGALSEEHVDVIAEVMVKEELPAEAEQPLVDYARRHEPRELRAFARALAYRLKQNDPEPRDEEPRPPVNLLVRRWGRQRCKGWFDLDGEFGGEAGGGARSAGQASSDRPGRPRHAFAGRA